MVAVQTNGGFIRWRGYGTHVMSCQTGVLVGGMGMLVRSGILVGGIGILVWTHRYVAR